jgi:hypothetical protein
MAARLKARCIAAWRRFVACAELLPESEAAPLWVKALDEFLKLRMVRSPSHLASVADPTLSVGLAGDQGFSLRARSK